MTSCCHTNPTKFWSLFCPESRPYSYFTTFIGSSSVQSHSIPFNPHVCCLDFYINSVSSLVPQNHNGFDVRTMPSARAPRGASCGWVRGSWAALAMAGWWSRARRLAMGMKQDFSNRMNRRNHGYSMGRRDHQFKNIFSRSHPPLISWT